MCFLSFSEELRDHFGQYGEIESINVKTDPTTGRSRGFAFIVFKQAESIDKVSAAGEHTINNKKVDPKKAKARHGKIFVGGLTTDMSDDDIKNYFGQFGTVSDEHYSMCWNISIKFCFLNSRSLKLKCHLTRRKIKEKDFVSSHLNLNK